MPIASGADRSQRGRRAALALRVVLGPLLIGVVAGCGASTTTTSADDPTVAATASPADPSAVPAAVRESVAACQENPRTRGDLTRGEGVVPRVSPSGSAGSERSLDGADPLEAAEGILDGGVLGIRVAGAPVLVEEDADTAVVAVLRDEGPDVDGVVSLEQTDEGWQVAQLITCR